MNVISLQAYRDQRCDCSAPCPRAVTHWDDDEDEDLGLEDDEPWWRPAPRIILLAILLAPFARPAACVAAWSVLWGAYLAGVTPEPPPGPSKWMLW